MVRAACDESADARADAWIRVHLHSTSRSIRHGSAELVALAEAKLAGKPIDRAAIAAAVEPLKRAEMLDTVVLACTHFPLLSDELADALPCVQFVDGGLGIARRIAFLTQGQPWPDEPSPGIAVFNGPHAPGLDQALTARGLSELRAL